MAFCRASARCRPGEVCCATSGADTLIVVRTGA
jgi:hypothetical protein